MPRGSRINKADQAWAIERSLSTDVKYCRNQPRIKLSDLATAYEMAPSELILQRYGVEDSQTRELPDGNRQPRATFLKFADRRASAAEVAAYKCTERIHRSGTDMSGGENTRDSTSFHPGQWDVCDCCTSLDVHHQVSPIPGTDDVSKAWGMPPVICNDDGTEIRRPIEDKPKYDENGQPIRDTNGNYAIEYLKDPSGKVIEHPLYDFEILPFQISRAESPWMFEMWSRVDPRIQWSDIAIRMLYGDGGRRPSRNTMNMACVRLRNKSGMKDWKKTKLVPPSDTASSSGATTISVNVPALEAGWNPFRKVKKSFKRPSSKPEDETLSNPAHEREVEQTASSPRTQKRKVQFEMPTRKRQRVEETDTNALIQPDHYLDTFNPDFASHTASDLTMPLEYVDIGSFYNVTQTQHQVPGENEDPGWYLDTLHSFEPHQYTQEVEEFRRQHSPELQTQHTSWQQQQPEFMIEYPGLSGDLYRHHSEE